MWNTKLPWPCLVLLTLSAALFMPGCPTQTSGDDDDDAINDDDTTGGDDDTMGGQWEVVFSDDFDRADGALGDDYEVLVFVDGVVEIQNGAVFADADYFAIRYLQPVNDDVIRVTVDAIHRLAGSVEDGAVALTARYAVDPNSDFPSYSARLDATADEIAVQRSTISGIDGQLSVEIEDVQSFDLQSDALYRVVLTVGLGDVTMSSEDVAGGTTETLTIEDPDPLTAGIVGIYGYAPGDVLYTFDDLLIERYVP